MVEIDRDRAMMHAIATKPEDRAPFLVTGGKCKKILSRVWVHNQDAFAERLAFAERFGAADVTDFFDVGWLGFSGPPPRGWDLCREEFTKYNYSDVRNYEPSAPEIKEEMASLPRLYDRDDLAQFLECPATSDGERITCTPHFERVGTSYVLWISKVDIAAGYRPPGESRQLKMSEYWTMVEQFGTPGESEPPYGDI